MCVCVRVCVCICLFGAGGGGEEVPSSLSPFLPPERERMKERSAFFPLPPSFLLRNWSPWIPRAQTLPAQGGSTVLCLKYGPCFRVRQTGFKLRLSCYLAVQDCASHFWVSIFKRSIMIVLLHCKEQMIMQAKSLAWCLAHNKHSVNLSCSWWATGLQCLVSLSCSISLTCTPPRLPCHTYSSHVQGYVMHKDRQWLIISEHA